MIGMIDIVVGAIIVLIVALALVYIVREKRKGKCIGCPVEGGCSSCHGCCHTAGTDCGCHPDTK